MFLGLSADEVSLETAQVVVVPIPYDSTTSYRTGAREGPQAILEASRHLEEYDRELDVEVAKVGIYTLDQVEPHMGGPQAMIERVRDTIRPLVRQGKIPLLLGGEHSLTIGAVRALREVYEDLSVLYLDAHGDFRQEYMGTPFSHACVARRIWETCPLVAVGQRSLSREEARFIKEHRIPVFPWEGPRWRAEEVAECLSPHVYVSVDLDVLDPSIMAAVGNPEPGGMLWTDLLDLLRTVACRRRLVGFDLMELTPGEGPTACAFTAAKLGYKLIGYACFLGQAQEEARVDYGSLHSSGSHSGHSFRDQL